MASKVASNYQPDLTVAERAAKAMQKNRLKKRPAKTAPASAAPAAKKQKTVAHSRGILYDADAQLKTVLQNLGCSAVRCPLTGKDHLYSTLSAEPAFFYAYPVLLGAPEAKGKLKSSTEHVCGVTKQELVFSVLRKSFADLFGSKLAPEQIEDWDLWKWNKAYYGQSVVKRAPTWIDLQNKHMQHRFLGGDKCPTHVTVFNEVNTAKSSKALDMGVIFKNNKHAACFERQFLINLREEAEQLAAGKVFISKSELQDRLDETRDESDSESEEDEEYAEDE